MCVAETIQVCGWFESLGCVFTDLGFYLLDGLLRTDGADLKKSVVIGFATL